MDCDVAMLIAITHMHEKLHHPRTFYSLSVPITNLRLSLKAYGYILPRTVWIQGCTLTTWIGVLPFEECSFREEKIYLLCLRAIVQSQGGCLL